MLFHAGTARGLRPRRPECLPAAGAFPSGTRTRISALVPPALSVELPESAPRGYGDDARGGALGADWFGVKSAFGFH